MIPRAPSRSGFLYVLVLVAVLVVSAVALVLARGVSQHDHAEQTEVAQAKSRAAALGVIRALTRDPGMRSDLGIRPSVVKADGEIVDDCLVLLLGRDPDGIKVRFGLVPEAGKLSVSSDTVTAGQLATLPGMTTAIASAIVDWRDQDDAPSPGGGAERNDGAYVGAAVPYAPRNGDPDGSKIETVDEVRLVRDVTDPLWFGEDANCNGVLDAGEDQNGNGQLDQGMVDWLTSETREPSAGTQRASVGALPQILQIGGNITVFGVLTKHFGAERAAQLQVVATRNQNSTGPRYANRLEFLSVLNLSDAELAVLWPDLIDPGGRLGLVDAESAPASVLRATVGEAWADRILTARKALTVSGPGWLVRALDRDGAREIGSRLTIGSWQAIADVVAVSLDGAGFTRCQVRIDASTGSVQLSPILPLDHLGWPFPWCDLATIRSLSAASTGSDIATVIAHRITKGPG